MQLMVVIGCDDNDDGLDLQRVFFFFFFSSFPGAQSALHCVECKGDLSTPFIHEQHVAPAHVLRHGKSVVRNSELNIHQVRYITVAILC